MATATKTIEIIREEVYGSAPMRVDREKGIIFGVKCLGRESKNGRVYSDRALDEAIELYKERDVNLDHSVEERKMAEGFGVIRDPVRLPDGVYGDLHYLTSHPLASTIAERAEKFPKNFGMSHDASGVLIEGGAGDGRDLIESLDRVESIDIVRKPATTGGLYESEGGSNVTTKTKGRKPDPTTVRKILSENAKHDEAKVLSRLLEEEGMEPMADAPVEVESGVSSDDQVKAAFRAMVIAAFDDSSLDTKATLAKIRDILKAQEKLAGGSSKSGGSDSEAPAEDDVAESFKTQIAALNLREDRREVLEEAGIRRSDLNESQRKLLDKASSREAMEELVESWDVKPESSRPNRARPAIGSRRSVQEDRRSASDEGKSYAELKEEIRRKGALKTSTR